MRSTRSSRPDPARHPTASTRCSGIEENQLGRRNLPDDQRAALVLRMADRRTALSKAEQRKAAGEASAKTRWGNEVIDADRGTKRRRARTPQLTIYWIVFNLITEFSGHREDVKPS